MLRPPAAAAGAVADERSRVMLRWRHDVDERCSTDDDDDVAPATSATNPAKSRSLPHDTIRYVILTRAGRFSLANGTKKQKNNLQTEIRQNRKNDMLRRHSSGNSSSSQTCKENSIQWENIYATGSFEVENERVRVVIEEGKRSDRQKRR